MKAETRVTMTTRRHGRIVEMLSPTVAVVRWEDGSTSEEHRGDLTHRGPTNWRNLSDDARAAGEPDPFAAWR